SIGYQGGPVTLTVAAPAACAWAVTTDAEWLVPGTTPSGTGNATVNVNVTGNFDEQRVGHIVVGGRIVTIAQDGRPHIQCEVSLSPDHNSAMAQIGGSSNFDVNVTAGCEWGAWANGNWMHVLTPTGQNNGLVTYVADSNPGFGSRTATITLCADANCLPYT